jgi:hypothetical protein
MNNSIMLEVHWPVKVMNEIIFGVMIQSYLFYKIQAKNIQAKFLFSLKLRFKLTGIGKESQEKTKNKNNCLRIISWTSIFVVLGTFEFFCVKNCYI